jgi:hypothetical protein
LTLRLTSPQYWYQPGKTPRFAVHVSSGQRQPCRFTMGAKSVSVVIASGHRQLWNSADCASNGSHAVTLADGKPAVLHVSWDRKTSSPGCSGDSHLVLPGEYTVTAVAGRLHSKSVNVVLGAKGAAQP